MLSFLCYILVKYDLTNVILNLVGKLPTSVSHVLFSVGNRRLGETISVCYIKTAGKVLLYCSKLILKICLFFYSIVYDRYQYLFFKKYHILYHIKINETMEPAFPKREKYLIRSSYILTKNTV